MTSAQGDSRGSRAISSSSISLSCELAKRLRFCVIVGLATVVLAGCGRGLVIRGIAAHDKIIRMYERASDPDVTIVISKWGDLYRKWRVTNRGRALLYQVDVNTHICWAVLQVVPCGNVKRDADMQQYIDW